jgi:hypothetical protein
MLPQEVSMFQMSSWLFKLSRPERLRLTFTDLAEQHVLERKVFVSHFTPAKLNTWLKKSKIRLE